MVRRGRKKGSKNKQSGRPVNFAFWKLVLSVPEELQDFLTRGSNRQKECIKNALVYLKGIDSEFFDDVNGKEILRSM